MPREGRRTIDVKKKAAAAAAGITEGKEDTAEVEEKASTEEAPVVTGRAIGGRDMIKAVKAVMGKAAAAAVRKAGGKAAKEGEKAREITARNAEQIKTSSAYSCNFLEEKQPRHTQLSLSHVYRLERF